MVRQYIALVVVWLCVIPLAAHAAPREGIRDTEIEIFLHDITLPLLQAAQLAPEAVTVHLLANNEPNAFVANGQNIFLHTGLLQLLPTPEQLSGVLAHEIGHIRGGHIVRGADVRRKNLTTALISGALIGAAGAVAGGGEQVVAGALLGGVQTGQLTQSAHSRTQEASADQAAIDILRTAGVTAQGLPQVLQLLSQQSGEQFNNSANDYVRSHPVSAQRMRLLHESLSLDTAPALSPNIHQRYARIRGKLAGFLLPPDEARALYPTTDDSLAAHYARAVAAHREGRLPEALALLKRFPPNDPYAHELRGQLLYESGQLPQAVAAYRQAVTLLPNNDLLTMQLAITLAALKQPATDAEALGLLKQALLHDPYESGYRTAAEVASRLNRANEAVLFSAQAAWQRGDVQTAHDLATRAKQLLPAGSAQGYIAQDLLRQTDAALAQIAKDN